MTTYRMHWTQEFVIKARSVKRYRDFFTEEVADGAAIGAEGKKYPGTDGRAYIARNVYVEKIK